MKFDVAFQDGRRSLRPQPVFGPPSAVDPDARRPVSQPRRGGAGIRRGDGGAGGAGGPRRPGTVEKKALIGASRKEESLQPLGIRGAVTALALDGRGDDLFVGTSAGQVLHFDMRDKGNPKEMQGVQATSGPGVPVTALGFLIGDRTLVVGDRAGAVSTWQVVPPASGGEPRLTRIYEFAPACRPGRLDQPRPSGTRASPPRTPRGPCSCATARQGRRSCPCVRTGVACSRWSWRPRATPSWRRTGRDAWFSGASTIRTRR